MGTRVPEFHSVRLAKSGIADFLPLQIAVRPDDTGHVRVAASIGPASRSAFVSATDAVTVAFMLLKSAAMACPTDDLPALRRRMDDLMLDTGFRAGFERADERPSLGAVFGGGK